MRIILEYVLPLLAPTVLYLLWMRFAANQEEKREVPWLWLAAAGIALAAIVLAGLSVAGGNKGGIYVPPHMEDGKLVPGHFLPSNSQY